MVCFSLYAASVGKCSRLEHQGSAKTIVAAASSQINPPAARVHACLRVRVVLQLLLPLSPHFAKSCQRMLAPQPHGGAYEQLPAPPIFRA